MELNLHGFVKRRKDNEDFKGIDWGRNQELRLIYFYHANMKHGKPR